MSTDPDTVDTSVAPFPFGENRLSELDRDEVDNFVRHWGQTHCIDVSKLQPVVAAYMDLCSFPAPSTRALRLSTEYLVWFLLLNDHPAFEERQSMIDTALSTLRVGTSDGTPVGRTTHALVQQLIAAFRTEDTNRLFRWMETMLESSRWEADQSEPPPFGAFVRHREHTIGVYPFIEIWRLGEDTDPTPEEWHPLERLECLNVRIIFTTNDLLSVNRDLRKGKLNGIFSLARERAMSLDAAATTLRLRLETLVEEFSDTLVALQKTPGTRDQTSRYAKYLGTCAEGNRIALVDLKRRYARHPETITH